MSTVAVFIPCYNQRHCIEETVQSVLRQTRPADQIILVDDASTDGSREFIRACAARHPGLLEPVYHTENQGISPTRIDALNRVRCDYVTYVDGDDEFLEHKLEREAGALDRTPDADFVYSNHIYCHEDTGEYFTWVTDTPPPTGNVWVEVFSRSFPWHRLFRMEMVRYGAWKRVGFLDPGLKVYEDFEMRIRLARTCRCVYIDEPLARIHEHGRGLSKTDARVRFDALMYIYRKHQSALRDLDAATARNVRKEFRSWTAHEAVRALQRNLADSRPPPWRRVARNIRYLYFCLRHHPSLLEPRLIRAALWPWGPPRGKP